MRKTEAQKLASEIVAEYLPDWKAKCIDDENHPMYQYMMVQWKGALACSDYHVDTIWLSPAGWIDQNVSDVVETVKHEIAHSLTHSRVWRKKNWHGKLWQNTLRKLLNDKKFYDYGNDVNKIVREEAKNAQEAGC